MLCALVVSTGAQADPRWGHGWGHHWAPRWHHPEPSNPLGSIVGGMIGGWIGSQLNKNDEDEDELEPWGRAWFGYCSRKYRSFDPDSGTYLGFDGVRKFCK